MKKTITAAEAKETAKAHFASKGNEKDEKYFVTADGNCFRTKAAADTHSKDLKSDDDFKGNSAEDLEAIHEITRAEVITKKATKE